jgi:hypothetical protein
MLGKRPGRSGSGRSGSHAANRTQREPTLTLDRITTAQLRGTVRAVSVTPRRVGSLLPSKHLLATSDSGGERAGSADPAFDELAPGEAEHLVTGDGQCTVPFMVAVKGLDPTVKLEAVHFDDDSEFRPVEVHLDALEPLVHERQRQAEFENELPGGLLRR